MHQKLDETEAPLNYDELDPGVRETVRFLRDHGFETTDSGDGYTKFPDGHDEPPTMDCALPVANIAITTDPEKLVTEADRLMQLLLDSGVNVGTTTTGTDDLGYVEIQAGYDPVDGSALILVLHLDDAKLYRARTFS